MVFGLGGLSAQFAVVEELDQRALSAVEVLQVMNGLIVVVQLACFVVDDVRTGHRLADAVEQRVLMRLGGCAAVVAVEQLHIVGIGANDGERPDALRKRKGRLSPGPSL